MLTTANNIHRLKWPKPIRWLLKMDRLGGLPEWWQWFIPRYGLFGGVGWSMGLWLKRGDKTDWTVSPINDMDLFFKHHDWGYQNEQDLDDTDSLLVFHLRQITVQGCYDKAYRVGAIVGFSIWPKIRKVLNHA